MPSNRFPRRRAGVVLVSAVTVAAVWGLSPSEHEGVQLVRSTGSAGTGGFDDGAFAALPWGSSGEASRSAGASWEAADIREPVLPSGLADPNQLAGSARDFHAALRPQGAGGRIDGFEIQPGHSPRVFNQAGLQPGDIITAVNGQAFQSIEKVIELPAEIVGSYAVEFTFVRDGQPRTAVVPVR